MTILASPNSSVVNHSHPLNRGLAGWWLPGFGGRTGNTLSDLSGRHGHMIRGSGVPWQTGMPSGWGSLRISQSNFVGTAFDNSWESLTEISIFGWFVHEAVVNAIQTAFRVIDVEGGFDVLSLYRQNSGNLLVASILKLAASTHTATTAMPDGWFHGGLTWEGDGDINLYVNGVLKATTATTISEFNSSNRTCKLTLGLDGTDCWEGRAGDLRRYNRILSESEAWQLYTLSRQGYPGILNRVQQRAYSVGGGSATITIDPGTYALTGTAISLEQGYKILIDPGTYTSIGTPIDLEQGYKVDIGLGSYSLTGTDIGLERGYLVSIDPGNYSISGTDTVLEFNRVIQITPGVYFYDGTDVSLISGETITLDVGSYSLSGTDVSLEFNREIAITPGVYTVTGTDINLEQGYEIALDVGSYSITGVDVTFNEGFTLSLDAGSYAIATKLGPSFGGSYTNDNSVGTHSWTMPELADADDEMPAGCSAVGVALNTQYLKALNFSDPPMGSSIVGIEVQVDRSGDLGSNPTEFLRLVVAGVVVGDEKSGTIGTGVETYGGALDTWGLSLTRDQVAANDFGVVYRATAGSQFFNQVSVDFIRMSIYYLDPIGLIYKRVLDVTPGVYTYTGTDVTLVVAGESIEGGQFIVGQSYIPGFKQAEIYVPGFQQAESFNPGFKQAEVN